MNCVQTLDCAGKHQVLIFVHSRKETAKTARYLKEEALKEDRLAQFMKVRLPRIFEPSFRRPSVGPEVVQVLRSRFS